MGHLLNGTPVLEIVLENPMLSTRYPDEGNTFAVFDTGYEGFAIIPENLFKKLRFDELSQYKRAAVLPNGSIAETVGTYGKLTLSELNLSKDGFVEASRGVEEVVVGVEFAKDFRFLLDYCARRFEVVLCR